MAEQRSGRVFRGDDFWRAEIKGYWRSGLTVADYCRRRGLAFSTFSRKRRKLSPGLAGGGSSCRAGRREQSSVKRGGYQAQSNSVAQKVSDDISPSAAEFSGKVSTSSLSSTLASFGETREIDGFVQLPAANLSAGNSPALVIKLPTGIALEISPECDLTLLDQVILLCYPGR